MATEEIVQSNNMSTVDVLKAYYNYAYGRTMSIYKYARRYQNFFSVANNVIRNNYPIIARLKDGSQKLFRSQIEIWLDLAQIPYDKNMT